MPIIDPMTLQETVLKLDEVYKSSPASGGGLFDPGDAGTLEILNGALDRKNFKDGFKVEPWMCQIGTFAAGAYWGSDKLEFVTSSQIGTNYETLNGDDVTKEGSRFILPTLSRRLFIPWPTSRIIYGYQGFFRQEAMVYNSDGAHDGSEKWDIRVKVNGTMVDSLRTILPAGCGTVQDGNNSGAAKGGAQGCAEHQEDRFRYVEKTGVTRMDDGGTNVAAPGYLTLEVSMGWSRHSSASYYHEADTYKTKVTIPSCAAWVLALR